MVLRTSLTPLGGGVKNPYKPQTVLVYSGGEHTFAAELPKGVFKAVSYTHLTLPTKLEV